MCSHAVTSRPRISLSRKRYRARSPNPMKATGAPELNSCCAPLTSKNFTRSLANRIAVACRHAI
jgi:hypothetical protein